MYEYTSTHFLTFPLNRDQLAASHFGCITSEKRAPKYPLISGMNPRAFLEAVILKTKSQKAD
jgi:hypothetical protein